jgi:hypothetical protein
MYKTGNGVTINDHRHHRGLAHSKIIIHASRMYSRRVHVVAEPEVIPTPSIVPCSIKRVFRAESRDTRTEFAGRDKPCNHNTDGARFRPDAETKLDVV